jgi:large subunit ribosomal protein L30
MTDKVQRTIHIKWVRSGIGFDHSQSEVVRSLGLRRLNDVVERPDTPQVRGSVAKVAHLVEVVKGSAGPVWNATPAYRIIKVVPSEPAATSQETSLSAIPSPVSERAPIRGEGASASSASDAAEPSPEPATAPKETVSSTNERGEKE